jgi:hypothetical protein
MAFNVMFHVERGYLLFFQIAMAVFFSAMLSQPVSPAHAGTSDPEMAKHIAYLLGEKFSPDSLSVTVKESRAYAEMKGVMLSGIRIDSMRLSALLTNKDAALSDDVDSLASLIGYSRGELVLLEADVNAYFDENEQSGFSKLSFDFSPAGFTANGIFSAEFLFTLRIRLKAKGVLELKHDGVYLGGVAIYVENIKQPDALTKQIVSRVNPLLEFSDIPFKVEFDTITMSDSSAEMSGAPEKITGGSTAVWKAKAGQ